MIDIENYVLTNVRNAIRTALLTTFPTIVVAGEYNDTPEKFPFVTVVEEDNTTYQKTLTNGSLSENHAEVMYEVNVYCTGTGKKANARRIAQCADDAMQNMKFTRSFYGQTPNMDKSVYRMTMRYRAVVEKGITSGTTTTYQMYRN